MFKKIVFDLVKFVGLRIRNFLKIILDLEFGDWIRLGVFYIEFVFEELWGGKFDYLKFIFKVKFGFVC